MTTLTGSTFYLQQSVATIQYSSNRTSWTTISTWPVTLATIDATLSFTTDLSFSASSHYFIIGAANQTIDGSFNIVYVNNVTTWEGLVKNGNYGYTGTTISNPLQSLGGSKANSSLKNIAVQAVGTNALPLAYASTGSILETTASNNGKAGAGWLTHIYYGVGTTGHTIDYCCTNGPSKPNYWKRRDGLIIGPGGMGFNNGGCLIGNSGGNITVTRCFSSGTIGSFCGGIFARGNNGSITNCYTTGSDMNGLQSNFGLVVGANVGNCVVRNTYSTAAITQGAGIFAGNANYSSAINCYTIGLSNTSPVGTKGIYSSGTGFTITNCYTTNGAAWSDTTANTNLDNTTGVWTDISLGSNTVPWRLSVFTRNLYGSSTGSNVTSVSNIISGSHTWSIVSISVNGGANVATYSGISINSSTGLLSFSGLSTGTYAVNVMAEHSVTTGYYFQTYTNTVASTRVVSPTNIFTLTSSRDLSGIFAPYTSSSVAAASQVFCLSGGSYFDLNAIFKKYTGANGTAEATGILCLSGGVYFDLNTIFEKK